MGDIHKVLEIVREAALVEIELIVGQIDRLTEGLGVDDGACAELEGLEPLVCIGDVLAGKHYAVVLHNHGLILRVLAELLCNLLAEGLAARNVVWRETDRAADGVYLREDAGVWNLMNDAKCHKSCRMCVDDAAHLRAHPVERPVERIL